MANASKKKMGVGTQGKGNGTGAMTVLKEGVLPENMVLSDRDKAIHSGERGLDSRQVQTDQFHDHVGARRTLDTEGAYAPDDDERVRLRAYQLWEEEGRPDARQHEHWLAAERLVRGK